MENVFLNIYRRIVGSEYGFSGEGNEQWYYSLSLAINVMLIWWLNPEVALLFTILAAIHYLTVFVYGYFDLSDAGVTFSYAYLGIHAILFTIAILVSFKWAIITTAITTVTFLLAPDCTGNNIFIRDPYLHNQLPLLFHTIIFVAFVIIDFLLPIKLWIKLLLIIGAIVIHPVIDLLEGECVIISDVTYEAFDNIFLKKSRKKH